MSRMMWATAQSLEMSLALVEALLDEVQARSVTAAVVRAVGVSKSAPSRTCFNSVQSAVSVNRMFMIFLDC